MACRQHKFTVIPKNRDLPGNRTLIGGLPRLCSEKRCETTLVKRRDPRKAGKIECKQRDDRERNQLARFDFAAVGSYQSANRSPARTDCGLQTKAGGRK